MDEHEREPAGLDLGNPLFGAVDQPAQGHRVGRTSSDDVADRRQERPPASVRDAEREQLVGALDRGELQPDEHVYEGEALLE